MGYKYEILKYFYLSYCDVHYCWRSISELLKH